MKTTDESALAVLDSILMRISFPNNERAINNLPEHAAMRDHIAARLAADQQKGGGESVAFITLTEDRDGEGWPKDPLLQLTEAGRKLPPGRYELSAAPQPSIPAPAQQDAVNPSKMLRAKVRPGAAFGVAVIDVDCADFGPNTIGDGHEILIHNLTKNPLAQQFVHGHRTMDDLPAQQDGKASGGEVIGYIDAGEDGSFVEFYPDRNLPLGAEVFIATQRSPDDGARYRQLVSELFADDSGIQAAMDSPESLAAYLDAALAHPPHADQETQG